MTPLVLAGPAGADAHDGGPSHPEQPARVRAVMEGVRALGLGDEVVSPAYDEAPMEDLARVHAPAYLMELEAFCTRGGGDLDPDTFARADSWRAARRAAGAGLAALDELERLGDGVAFVPVRPPGHHACGDRAMGFCLINNVAVAAASRVARGQRVLIVDWDVHHGIGSTLLDDLADAARARGVTAFRADTLAENHAMLDVFRHTGFPVSARTEYGTVTLRFPIAPTADYEAARARRGSWPTMPTMDAP